MKRLTITTCIAAFLFVAATAQSNKPSKATNVSPGPPPAGYDQEAMMQKWMQYMTPGRAHQMMASWDGTWTGEVTLWMDPSAPPTKSKMTAENKMIMGGRYQMATNKGDFNGMPFEGMSTLGFDNHKKVFISAWVDNLGTGIMVLEGPWDEATKTMTLTGRMVDPSSAREMAIKETFQVINNDHQLMEMFHIGPDGKDVKTMEIKFTRKK